MIATHNSTNKQHATQHQLKNKEYKNKELKNIYGEFHNVSLTDNEHLKLHIDFGNENELIEYLSIYKEDKPYKNKSDYLSIRRWVVEAVKKKKPIKEKSINPFLDHVKERENERGGNIRPDSLLEDNL